MSEKPKENFLLVKARVCEEMERYERMVKFMKEAVDEGVSFNTDQRNLFSVAYKNVVGTRRSAWRVAQAREVKETDDTVKKAIKEEKHVVETELDKICMEVVGIIEKILNNDDEKDAPTKVFYLKMKGDYYRYLSEIEMNQESDEKKDNKDNAKTAYEEASKIAEDLLPTHPIRLGLALNFSVFYYEIMSVPEKACELAKKAFDDAIADLDTLKEDSYKDSTLIMQLLRDNLTLWTSEKDQTEEEEQN